MENKQEQQEAVVQEQKAQEQAATEQNESGKPKKGSKEEKEAKKKERLEKRQQQQKGKGKKEEEEQEVYEKDENDPCASKFGDLLINRSQSDPDQRYARVYTAVKNIEEGLKDQEVWVRGRLHTSRAQGKKMCFVVLREQFATVQACLFVSETVSPGMLLYAKSIPKESIIEVKAKVVVPDQPVQGTSQKVELHISEIWTVNKSAPILPFQLADASRKVENQAEEDVPQEQEKQVDQKKEESKEKKNVVVKQDVRLNNRMIDLRVPANQALMRIQSGVCQLFREYLYSQDFVEIHSPKLIGGTSEGGANVFRLEYFGEPACLAQSPQLYKQMVICGDFQKVFEIGPVFRAEDSNTNRHLCEFTGLDIEMVFKQHYFEILDVLADMFVFIFKGLESRFKKELAVVNEQYSFEPFQCAEPVVRLNFKEGVALLKEKGFNQEPLEDLSTENEKMLGKIVKEKYHTDFYMLYGYPTNARPFYTMLDPHDPNYTNSYDFFMRGEEITSGAQRIHDPEFLAERAIHHKIPVNTIQEYIDSFKYGAPPHGGCGIGLERVVKLFCGIQNIRKCSLFPRDPKRLRP